MTDRDVEQQSKPSDNQDSCPTDGDRIALDYFNCDLYDLFFSERKRRSQKWHHYFPIYDWHFRRFRCSKPTIVEIGVAGGGSLEIWRRYFGEDARIIGVDLNPICKRFEEEGYEIIIGDQGSDEFLSELKKGIGTPDIIIDDGSHKGGHTIKTFQQLFPILSNSGVYLAEDVHTALWPAYSDRYDGLSFLDYAKAISEKLTWWHIRPNNARYKTHPSKRDGEVTVPEIARHLWSVAFYDSVVVFEKRPVPEPWNFGR